MQLSNFIKPFGANSCGLLSLLLTHSVMGS